MKPIAAVHWIEDDQERTISFERQQDLDAFVRDKKEAGAMFWTCLCDTRASVPRETHRNGRRRAVTSMGMDLYV